MRFYYNAAGQRFPLPERPLEPPEARATDEEWAEFYEEDEDWGAMEGESWEEYEDWEGEDQNEV